jgi:hypothetical protein
MRTAASGALRWHGERAIDITSGRRTAADGAWRSHGERAIDITRWYKYIIYAGSARDEGLAVRQNAKRDGR